jgi:hypothetical protein
MSRSSVGRNIEVRQDHFVLEKRAALVIALVLMVLGVVLRLLPHPPNFAPVTAIAIFGGAVLPRRLAIWTPLILMMVSDAIIGFHNLIVLTWGCYALTALASSQWLRDLRLIRGVVLTLSSSVFFFVVTNFGVWITSGMYAHSWAGLANCYVLALPFFRNSLLSDVFYTGVFFAAYRLAIIGVRASFLVQSQVE